jgi:hypothetical protein
LINHFVMKDNRVEAVRELDELLETCAEMHRPWSGDGHEMAVWRSLARGDERADTLHVMRVKDFRSPCGKAGAG